MTSDGSGTSPNAYGTESMYNEYGEYIGENPAQGEYRGSKHQYAEGPDTVDTPRTGDENNLALWILLSAIFAAGALYSLKRLSDKRD